MSPSIETLVLSGFPEGSEIAGTCSYRPGYREYPLQISVRTPGGAIERWVIKTGERAEAIEREAAVLHALAAIGLPVPAVPAGPLPLDDEAGAGAAMLLSELPGEPLPWLGLTSLSEADLTCRLLIRGVARLHGLTEAVRRHPVAAILPRDTLASELDEIAQSSAEWQRVELFARALERLPAALTAVELPLVFSNGDYNPLNFLHSGEELTGWVDFEGARFEDPHIGFAKFLIWSRDEWGWGAGVKAGLVERYLYVQNVSRREFAPRLVLRCLRHLQQAVPVSGHADAEQREYVLGLLEEGMGVLDG